LFSPLVDPCHQYETLNSSDKNINNEESPDNPLCDSYQSLSSSGSWYRFQGAAGTRLPTQSVQQPLDVTFDILDVEC